MNRRSFIRLSGGGVVLAAAGAGLYGYASRSVFPVPETAIAAWKEAGRDADPRRHALSFAILAPNPHNMQPWKADLRTPGEISVSLDEQRLLPETDPFGRQILMGLGAFLELLAMAAAANGHKAKINLFPDGVPGEYLDGRRMARIVFQPDAGAKADPLFEQVLHRRTDRRAYDADRPVADEEIAALSKAASAYKIRFGVEDGERLDAIKAIARAAWLNELTTEGPMMESVRVLRVGTAEIDAHRDGISIVNPLLVTIDRLGLFDRTKMPAADSQAVKAQIADFDAITEATPAYLWIITEGNSRQQQVEAGSAYVRVNLAGAAIGLSMHPNQQALQEFPEVAEQHAAIHALLGASSPGNTVQMLARLGRVRIEEGPVPPSPRRELPIAS
jgi:nitroreductase